MSADLDAPWVQSSKHIQRLQKQMLLRAQKQRRHKIPLGPAAFGLEPGDIIEWNSTRNGYIDKLFEVEAVDCFDNLTIVARIVELDEDDYDWNPGSDYTAPPSLDIDEPFPAAKAVLNFAVSPVTVVGASGVRPSIRVTWDDPEDDDTIAMLVEYRLAAAPNDVFTARASDVAGGLLMLAGDLQPDTDYEVRGTFESFSGWASAPTSWVPVTTPDARLGLDDLDDDLVLQAGQQLGGPGARHHVGHRAIRFASPVGLLRHAPAEVNAGGDDGELEIGQRHIELPVP